MRNFKKDHKEKRNQKLKVARNRLVEHLSTADVENVNLSKGEEKSHNLGFTKFCKVLKYTKKFYMRCQNTMSGFHSGFVRATRGDCKPKDFLPKNMSKELKKFYTERAEGKLNGERNNGLTMTNRERFEYMRAAA